MSYRDRYDDRDRDRDRGGDRDRDRDRGDRGGRRRPRDFGSERDKRYSTCLFVGNLPYHFRERDLGDYFSRCGRIRQITVGINRRNQQSKGYAFVEFEDRRDAEDAFEKFQGYNVEGRRLRIDWDVGLDKKGDSRPRRRSRSRSRSRSPRRSPSPRARSRSPSPRRSRSPAPRTSRSPSPGAAQKSPAPAQSPRRDGSPPPQEKRGSRSPSPPKPMND